MQAPLRLHLCHKFADDKEHTLQEIFDGLKDDYIGETHFTKDNLVNHIHALKAIGILMETNSDKGVDATYSVTNYGKRKIQKAL